ncbi:double-strand break repair helicase AddA [Martelella endophytica]|uniref:DNA 3'-5' helicase n=1 Tax=Martelella endophytica TaxID=1486262 RepID=A0A0D5LML4_MAREN|nr:double-strand break repair helicase AddA [Martelella endophytica]AJY45205.1 ATP-dependent DNA helicase [Martelella endophytica]
MTDEPTLSAPAEGWLSWTTGRQRLASDPARTVWVSANAGSGKTHVLTQRVVRLLLAGARPSAILCLTYTKAAASEMSNRVFRRLAEWAVLPEAELTAEIAEIEGARPDALKIAMARRLFAHALETPGGLKIQTIHAFCESLLHRFPLEANVAGHFSVLDDTAAATLLADARRQLLTATASREDPALSDAFQTVLDIADETGLEKLLGEIVAARHAIRPFLTEARRKGGIETALRSAYGFGEGDDEASIAAEAWPLPGLESLGPLVTIARDDGGSRAAGFADLLQQAVEATDAVARFGLLENAFLTASGTPKAESTLVFKSLRIKAPEIGEAVLAAAARIYDIRDRLNRFRIFEKTRAALTLADRLDARYEALKERRGKLDFEDLIARTATLLTRPDSGQWIHYKLDQGIDHILVDEAQDTAPLQWDVVRALSEDFFSGAGARPGQRTMFAVGDEKQSIYSFQGARPERFAEEGRLTRQRVTSIEAGFSTISLPLSFRSTASVLSAVDQVFSLPENRKGLSAADEATVHISNRTGHPGMVEAWEMIAPAEVVDEEDWTAPFDATPEQAPAAILARRIAQRISRMIGNDMLVEGDRERPVEAGDILVLVRKRDAFVNALTRALKSPYDIPVAGADRLKLADHIAVKDLMALGRFAVLPEDDLSLAAVFKSPLLDLSEDDLFAVAANRKPFEHVWSALRRLASAGDEKLRDAVEKLERVIAAARRRTAFDFYAGILAREGGRRAFLARLGSEAGDILDEFLNAAKDHEDTGLPGLQSFLDVLETGGLEVKREQDKGRNEVRIMTVHASKGLEAPVVFLVDSGGRPFVASHLSGFRTMEAGLPVWHGSKKDGDSAVTADIARREEEAKEEYRRLLYVAMTRAADRLFVTGYRGKTEVPDCWHRLVWSALSADDTGRCDTVEVMGPGEEQWAGLLWQEKIPPRRFEPASEATSSGKARPPLPMALTEAYREAARPAPPLSPSKAGIEVEDPAPLTASPLFAERRTNLALERGRLVHRLLQLLPGFAPEDRDGACRRYLERAGHHLPEDETARIAASVLTVMADPRLASVFAANARAEVSITGTVRLEGGSYTVSGRLDRLAVDGNRVVLVDFKTNRNPPEDGAPVPFSHAAQMAVYREILNPLYPEKAIDCVLVYTETAAVRRLDTTELAEALAGLTTK